MIDIELYLEEKNVALNKYYNFHLNKLVTGTEYCFVATKRQNHTKLAENDCCVPKETSHMRNIT